MKIVTFTKFGVPEFPPLVTIRYLEKTGGNIDSLFIYRRAGSFFQKVTAEKYIQDGIIHYQDFVSTKDLGKITKSSSLLYLFDIEDFTTDPIFIQVLETLPDEAYHRFRIREIPKGKKYCYDENEGYVSVITEDDFDWRIAE